MYVNYGERELAELSTLYVGCTSLSSNGKLLSLKVLFRVRLRAYSVAPTGYSCCSELCAGSGETGSERSRAAALKFLHTGPALQTASIPRGLSSGRGACKRSGVIDRRDTCWDIHWNVILLKRTGSRIPRSSRYN